MKNYKDFEKKYIGSSDIGSLIIRCPSNVDLLSFGGDGSYYAYECFGDVEIGEHYTIVFSGKIWLKLYDDTGLVYDRCERNNWNFNIYRAAGYGCIIHWFEDVEEF